MESIDKNKDTPKTHSHLNTQEAEFLYLIDKDLNYHIKRSKRLKRRANFFKISVMILGAIITIILGFEVATESPFTNRIIQNTALILGASITVLTAIGNFWNTEKYWLNNTLTFLKLVRIKNDFLFESKAATGFDPKIFTDLKTSFDLIQDAKEEYWEDAMNTGG